MPEALDLPRPQFPSLENEVIIIKPSLEHHEDRRVNMCGNRLAQGLMHRNRQVLNKRGPFLRLRPSLGSRVNRLRHSFIHSSLAHSFTPSFTTAQSSELCLLGAWALSGVPQYTKWQIWGLASWSSTPVWPDHFRDSASQPVPADRFPWDAPSGEGAGSGGADKRQKRRNFPESNTRREAAI